MLKRKTKTNSTEKVGIFYLTDTGKVIMKIRNSSKRFVKNRIKAFNREYKQGNLELPQIQQSMNSWYGHASHGHAFHLRKNIRWKLKLQREEVSDDKKI